MTDDTFKEPLGRRQRKALLVHRAMIEAGLAAFARRPIGMVSVLDITEAVDVAKGVFYLHFKSRDEFLIALWEDVRSSLLEMMNMEGAKARKTRIERAVEGYLRMAGDKPEAARFWIRMSGYFADEVGQPGQLTRVREEFLEQLAGLIAAVPKEQITPEQRTIAQVLDACCGGLVAQMIQLDIDSPVDLATFHKVVHAACRAAAS